MNPNSVKGLSEPPEGAIVGESVPTENDEHRVNRATIERVKHTLKGLPRFSGMADDELEEVAQEYAERLETED